MNKKILIIPAAAIVMGGLLFTTSQVSASSKSFADHPMIGKIAERFGLDEGEVESFMQEQKELKQAKMQQKIIDMLDEAIANGDLTLEQKELILQKHQEMKDNQSLNKENWRDLSDEEKKVLKESVKVKHDEMKNWLDENGISKKYFGLGKNKHDGGGKKGFKVGWGK